jgi:hypothetical protein
MMRKMLRRKPTLCDETTPDIRDFLFITVIRDMEDDQDNLKQVERLGELGVELWSAASS